MEKSQTKRGRPLGSKTGKAREVLLKIRLMEEEAALLAKKAGAKPLSTWSRETLLNAPR